MTLSEILTKDLSQAECREKLSYGDRTRTLVTPPTCLSDHAALCQLQTLCPNQRHLHVPKHMSRCHRNSIIPLIYRVFTY